MGCGHVLERLKRFFRLALLYHAHDGVYDDDEQNENRLEKFPRVPFDTGDNERNRRRREQDKDHHILELLGKALKIRFRILLRKHVFPVLTQAGLSLTVAEPVHFVSFQLPDDLFCRP